MPKNLPAIIYDKSKVTPIVDSGNAAYQLIYYKDVGYFSNYESYVNFIKGCERLVRQNDRYRKYINYLKTEVKLDHCQVLTGIDDKDADIEMHHGPIFTLYDICAIVLEYFIVKKWDISTAKIADAVLDEHLRNRVQVVMLSCTAHEEVHNSNIFIHRDQAFGDIEAFLKKYGQTMPEEYKLQYNRYVDRCMLYDSNDFGLFELNKYLYKN